MKLYAVFKDGKIELKDSVLEEECVLDVLEDEFKYIEDLRDKKTRSKFNFLNYSYEFFISKNIRLISALEQQIKGKTKKRLEHNKHDISDGYYQVVSLGHDEDVFYHNGRKIISTKEIKGDNDCFYFHSYSIDKHMSISYSDDGSEFYKLFLLVNKDKNKMVFIDTDVTEHHTFKDWLVYMKRPRDQMRSYQVILMNVETMEKKLVFQENNRSINLGASISLDGENLIVSGSDGLNEYVYVLLKMKKWKRVIPMRRINVNVNVFKDKIGIVDKRTDSYYVYLCPIDDVDIDSDKYLVHKTKFHTISDISWNKDFIVVLEYDKETNKSTIFAYDHTPKLRLKTDLDGKYSIEELSIFNTGRLLLSRLLYVKKENLLIDLNTKKYKRIVKNYFEDSDKYAYGEDYIDGIRIVYVYNKEVGIKHALLTVYGSYGISIDGLFDSLQLTLCDYGIACFMAFVRGGGENGGRWYEEGKLMTKVNTIIDTVKAGRYIKSKYLEKTKGKIGVWGTSAGGIAAAGALNRDDVFDYAILEVPFVDVLGTMFDTKQALTELEANEFGDPRKPEMYYYIKSYSPYQNIRKKYYPPTLIIVGMKDERVKYYEGIKFALRMMKNGAKDVLVKITDRGHFEYDYSEEYIRYQAEIGAFVIESVNE